MKDLATTFQATLTRTVTRIKETTSNEVATIVEDELRGLYHGLLVIFDGGTVLADEGLVSIVDEDGMAFDRHLHESCFDYWPPTR